ncbi:hypothetical protein GQ44DRAFT_723701 [Phaeosphaeriaceae sp. PMI808]|nr:hypothetical protein GQ44DRAFT_723701 [Phaeosphaeriaceae sp. PMI808]
MRAVQLGAAWVFFGVIDSQLFPSGFTHTSSFLVNATTSLLSLNATASALSFNATTNTSSLRGNATLVLSNATVTHPPLLPPTSLLYPNAKSNGTTNSTKNACQASYEAHEYSILYPEDIETTGSMKTSIHSWSWAWDLTTFSTEHYQCIQTCGSICYAGSISTEISTSLYVDIGTRTYTAYEDPPSGPLPNCTIPFNECLILQTSYSSAITSYYSMDDTYQALNTEPVRPYCSACSSTSCYFNGMFGMSLYYWPATTSVSRDFCASEPVGGPVSSHILDINHTYIPKTTGQYAVVNDITMYEGNVYVSYYEPQVYDNCGKSVRRQQSGGNRVITIASEALYSIRKYPNALAPFPVKWDLVPWSVNFDDFNNPVPWSAYSGQQMCAMSYGTETSQRCSVVKPGEYHPYIMMPPQIRNLDPAWKSCRFDEYAAYDPPVALTPQSMFFSSQVTPTDAGDTHPVKTPAAPGQPGGGGMPVITPRPGRPQKPNDDDRINDQMPSLQPPQGPVNGISTPTQGAEHIDAPRPEVTIGTSVVPVDPLTGLVIKPGVTIKPGEAPSIVDGTTFSIGSSNIVLGNEKGTTTFAIPPAISKQPVITVGSSFLPIDSPGRVIIRPGVTLIRGEPAITIDGTTMSIGSSGVVIIDHRGTSTVKVPAFNVATPAITIGPSVVPFDSSGGLIIRPGHTLRPGDPPVAIDGTTYNIGPSGVVIIDYKGTSTIPFPMSKEYITVGSQTFTLVNGKLIMGPQLTLSGPGGIMVMGSTTIILKSGKVEIISGSATSVIPIKSNLPEAKTSGGGLAQATTSSKKSAATLMISLDLRILITALLLCTLMTPG